MKKFYSILVAMLALVGLNASAETIYLVGDYCSWSFTDAKAFTETSESGVYEITESFTLKSGFKVATSDWSTVNLGGTGTALTLGQPCSLESPGSNIAFADGTECNVTSVVYDSNAATLTIEGTMSTTTPDITANPVYLRGDVNSWGATDDYKFVATDTENVLQIEREFTLTGAFKVASEDWSTWNLGSNGSALAADKAYKLVSGSNDNITLEASSIDVTLITLNISTLELTVFSKTSGISGVKAESQSPRYNLAGQRVGSSYKGMVIENGRKFMVK